MPARLKNWWTWSGSRRRATCSMPRRLKNWWTWSGSNRRPLPCHGSALPAAPQARLRICVSILTHTRWLVKPRSIAVFSRVSLSGSRTMRALRLEAICETCENGYADSEETKYEPIPPSNFGFAVRRCGCCPDFCAGCVLLIDFRTQSIAQYAAADFASDAGRRLAYAH